MSLPGRKGQGASERKPINVSSVDPIHSLLATDFMIAA
jgi:hypothetical protein